MSGYETLTAIMKDPGTRDIPVIFLTSQIDTDSERLGFRLGAKAFIKKPFDNEIMLARVQSQMELHLYRTQLEEMIKSRDGTTGAHVMRTAAYCEVPLRLLAELPAYINQLPDESIGDLIRASTLHDIGKIGISDTILKKPGSLDKEEFLQMQTHSQIGAICLKKLL